jgi:hypothetical protein
MTNENVDGPQKALPFGVSFDVVPGLDGKAWPRMQIINGLTAFILTLPMDDMLKFVDGISKNMQAIKKQVDEENNPRRIMKATPEDLARIQPNTGQNFR